MQIPFQWRDDSGLTVQWLCVLAETSSSHACLVQTAIYAAPVQEKQLLPGCVPKSHASHCSRDVKTNGELLGKKKEYGGVRCKP